MLDSPLAQTPLRAGSGLHLKIENVSRVYETGVVALDGVSLEIPAGQFLAILGPSGCGKSTLLRLIAGLDSPQSGRIDLKSSRTDISYVFQDAHLLPWRTVIRNVELPLELMGVSKSERSEKARLSLERVGLGDALQRYPGQLSGGMRMRVSLARALVGKPKLLLLDEPFAALDEITRQHLDDQLRELWLAEGMTVIFVTHSTAEAVFLAERAVVLSRRPGRIVEDRLIELPQSRTSDSRATAEFAREAQTVYDALKRGGA